MTSTTPKLRVAVGMSGGVDSSVAAALLAEQGHEVVGLTAHLWREGSRCCSLDDARRARQIADFLDIPHYLLNALGFFGERIVAPFVQEYAEGRTPSPCVRCNEVVKFGLLLREALALGCTHLATGHYARLARREDGWHLSRGRDRKKDQSYFLHRLDASQLAHSLFPLGDLTKPEVADIARAKKLPVIHDSESQDLCFVTEGGYAEFIEKRRPHLHQPGPITDTAGRVLGQHEGHYHFTIGQREGLAVAAAQRLYVKELHADTNTVIVAPLEETLKPGCQVEDVHWIRPAPAGAIECEVQLRYRHAGARATVRPTKPGGAQVDFTEPQFAVTPGQAAVFYDGDDVLGGGWIAAERTP
ncbi:MAG: tRNA 2-thiouridine(34) synthase MnmA [Kiritimatiellae bacterium]|nr:tRNA 2-thiouridine(34) synthase MnmA [Kiritimatiellia bacterium]